MTCCIQQLSGELEKLLRVAIVHFMEKYYFSSLSNNKIQHVEKSCWVDIPIWPADGVVIAFSCFSPSYDFLIPFFFFFFTLVR